MFQNYLTTFIRYNHASIISQTCNCLYYMQIWLLKMYKLQYLSRCMEIKIVDQQWHHKTNNYNYIYINNTKINNRKIKFVFKHFKSIKKIWSNKKVVNKINYLRNLHPIIKINTSVTHAWQRASFFQKEIWKQFKI